MSNIVQIKRGHGKPSPNVLTPYELGYDIDNSCLYIGNNTGDAEEIKSNILVKDIPSGSDLNDYRMPGFYKSAYYTNEIENRPPNISGAFELTVTSISPGNNTYCTQLIKDHCNNNYYIRTQCNWEEPWYWTAWTQIASKELIEGEDYGTQLPTAGTKGRIFYKKVT